MGAHQKTTDDGSSISPRCFVRGCFKDGMGTSVRVAPDVEFRLILCDPHRLEVERLGRRLERAAAGLPPVPMVAPAPRPTLRPVVPVQPKPQLVPVEACVVCDKPFETVSALGGRHRKTCGNLCRMRLTRARRDSPGMQAINAALRLRVGQLTAQVAALEADRVPPASRLRRAS
jgi:hypothetical protein